jgi:thiamine biosynthesis lipoprotein
MPERSKQPPSAIIAPVGRRPLRFALLPALLPALCLAALPALPDAVAPEGEVEAVRLSGRALGQEVTIEVLNLPAATGEAAVRAGLARLREVGALLDAATERLNADAGTERAVALEPAAAEILARALEFCAWSKGAHGPLGGSLAAHWRAAAGNPSPPPVPAALAESAACERLELAPDGATARIAPGSRVDLSGFAAGFAVDRAAEALREAGAANARVQVGRIVRAFGPGPPEADGQGWPVILPVFEGYERPLDEVFLDDAALALVWRADWPPGTPRHLDQRTGAPPGAVWATVAVTELAVDAQAVAVSALVLGAREGRFRIANLKPRPAVLWLLGRGSGRALRAELHWSALERP